MTTRRRWASGEISWICVRSTAKGGAVPARCGAWVLRLGAKASGFRARKLELECLAPQGETHDQYCAGHCLKTLSSIAASTGQHNEAAHLAGVAHALRVAGLISDRTGLRRTGPRHRIRAGCRGSGSRGVRVTRARLRHACRCYGRVQDYNVILLRDPPAVPRRRPRRPGLGLINSVGNLGGFVAPTMMGQIQERTGSVSGGLRRSARRSPSLGS